MAIETPIPKTSAPTLVGHLRDLPGQAMALARPGWPVLAVVVVLVSGVLTADALAAWRGWLLALLVVATSGALLARGRGKPVAGTTARVVAASVLMAMVVGFFLLLSVMAGGFVVFAVMAGSGFDFDAAGQGGNAFGEAFDAFRDTPGGQISQAVFWLAIAVWGVSLGRALPYAAATGVEGRLILLEAFNRSRGRGLANLVVLLVGMVPAIALLVTASSSGGIFANVLGALGWPMAALGLAAASATVQPAS